MWSRTGACGRVVTRHPHSGGPSTRRDGVAVLSVTPPPGHDEPGAVRPLGCPPTGLRPQGQPQRRTGRCGGRGVGLKLGRVRPPYFADKYGVDILRRFEEPLASLDQSGYLAEATNDMVSLTRAGLLRVDSLLPRFFQPKNAGIRYT